MIKYKSVATKTFPKFGTLEKLFLLFVFLLAACEKNITVNLPKPDEKLVVEGSIETGSFPFIILTKNSAFYSTFNLDSLNNYFVQNAVVKVSNGTDTVTCQEFFLDTMGVTLRAYIGLGMIGEEGKTYNLWINAPDGKKISAVTTIPIKNPLDSIWVTYNEKVDSPDLVRLVVRYTDHPQLGEYVRYFTKFNSEDFQPGLNSVFDDQIINGTTFDFPLDRGYNRNDSIDFDAYGYFHKGDTITVKWCNIDYAHFDFWRTMEFELGGQGSPFASPVKINTNITGGLGIWGGYAVNLKTVIVPE